MREVPWRYGRIGQGRSLKQVSIWQPGYNSRWQEAAKRFGRRCWGMPIDGSYIHTRNTCHGCFQACGWQFLPAKTGTVTKPGCRREH